MRAAWAAQASAMREWRHGAIIPQQPLPGPLPRSKAERFAPVLISPPYPHLFRRFWQQPSKSCQELLQATAPVGQMLNMAVDLDAVTGGENNPLAPFGILGQLFEWALKGVRGKMQS